MATNAPITGAPTCASPTHDTLDLADLGRRIQGHARRIEALANAAQYYLGEVIVPFGEPFTNKLADYATNADIFLDIIAETTAAIDRDGETVETAGVASRVRP